MNRQSTSRLVPSFWIALTALSWPLAATAGVADATAGLFTGPDAIGAAKAAPGPHPPAPLPPAPAAAAKSVATDPEQAGLLRLGTTLTERGDYATAVIAFWQILHRPGLALADEKSALLGLAHMYRKEGSVPNANSIYLVKAGAIYERFIKDFPNDERVPDALLELGRTQREVGAYKMAMSRFYSVINSTLKFPTQGFEHYESLAKTAQFEIAQTHFDAGEYLEAGKYFLKVRLLDLAPADRARAHFMAALSEQRAGEFEQSVVTLRSFIDQWPDDQNVPEARYFLATSLRQLNRHQEASVVTLELLRQEHAHDGADQQRWSYWQRRTGNQIANELFQNGDTFNALAIYKGLNLLSPDPAWRLPVTYQIGLCYERLRQMEDARAAYNLIIAAAKAVPGKPAPSPDVAQLAQMAAWRLAHLDWRDTVDSEFNILFANTAPPANSIKPTAPAPAPPPAPPPAPNSS
jgi:tetratricopeptide (TPR) repeat protein